MEKDMEFVVVDRYGYLSTVRAKSQDEATRIASNLSPSADLDYASSRCVGIVVTWSCVPREKSACYTAEEIYDSNRATARWI